MGSAGDTAENWILDAMLGSGHAAGFPNDVYVALFTAAPSDGGGGTEVGTSGTNYARAAVTNNDVSWPPASSSTKVNGITVQFNDALGDWGTVTSYALFDDPSTGNIIIYGNLDISRTINSGTSPFFAPGDMIFTAD